MPHTSQPPYLGQSHASGTVIDVKGGRKPVEDLQVGDLVRTKDNGHQPVRWIAARTLTRSTLQADPSLRPIRIRAGALGERKPARDLVVSPQHCVLLDDWRCELLFGEDEMLAPAQTLVNDDSITVDHDADRVTYYHFMFDRHEIVYSNGAETESFHPGAAGIDDVTDAKREELFRLYPELAVDTGRYGPQARAALKDFEVEVLMAI
ncbi:MAG: Hint domain-containing protein [Rhodobacter sp.]|nr:Hint domain-containing protein [Rhodobacter sp.]